MNQRTPACGTRQERLVAMHPFKVSSMPSRYVRACKSTIFRFWLALTVWSAVCGTMASAARVLIAASNDYSLVANLATIAKELKERGHLFLAIPNCV